MTTALLALITIHLLAFAPATRRPAAVDAQDRPVDG